MSNYGKNYIYCALRGLNLKNLHKAKQIITFT